MRRWLRELGGRQILAVVLFAVGILLTSYLAFADKSAKPPTQAGNVLIVLLTVSAQGVAAWLFRGRGTADPTHAERAAQRLVLLGRKVATARTQAEFLYEQTSKLADLKSGAGILSAQLSYVEQDVADAYEDWRIFHPAVQKMERGSVDNGS